MRESIDSLKIFETVFGSHLYGTESPNSDKDIIGIFIPSPDYLLGMKEIEEIDLSIESKDDSGKNTKDALDKKYYSYKKFIRLALRNNPNIVELFFANEKNTTFINDFGRNLLGKYPLFIHKGVAKTFKEYAKSQKHKMVIKTDKFVEMNLVYDYLQQLPNDKMIIAELKHDANFMSLVEKCKVNAVDDRERYKIGFHDEHLQIGDINIPVNCFLKEGVKRLKNRIDTGTNRNELILKYGYDCKFGYHLIRLLTECMQLLNAGYIEYPLRNREALYEIKTGKIDIRDILRISEDLEKEIDELVKISKLQEEPRFEEINSFMVEEMKRWLR